MYQNYTKLLTTMVNSMRQMITRHRDNNHQVLTKYNLRWDFTTILYRFTRQGWWTAMKYNRIIRKYLAIITQQVIKTNIGKQRWQESTTRIMSSTLIITVKNDQEIAITIFIYALISNYNLWMQTLLTAKFQQIKQLVAKYQQVMAARDAIMAQLEITTAMNHQQTKLTAQMSRILAKISTIMTHSSNQGRGRAMMTRMTKLQEMTELYATANQTVLAKVMRILTEVLIDSVITGLGQKRITINLILIKSRQLQSEIYGQILMNQFLTTMLVNRIRTRVFNINRYFNYVQAQATWMRRMYRMKNRVLAIQGQIATSRYMLKAQTISALMLYKRVSGIYSEFRGKQTKTDSTSRATIWRRSSGKLGMINRQTYNQFRLNSYQASMVKSQITGINKNGTFMIKTRINNY